MVRAFPLRLPPFLLQPVQKTPWIVDDNIGLSLPSDHSVLLIGGNHFGKLALTILPPRSSMRSRICC